MYIYQLEGRMEPRAAIEASAFPWPLAGGGFGLSVFLSPGGGRRLRASCAAGRTCACSTARSMTYAQWQGLVFAGELHRPLSARAALGDRGAAGPDDAPALTILLDPGLVFGAGTHPTTRDCLMALERAAADGAAGNGARPGNRNRHPGLGGGPLLGARVLAVDLNSLAAGNRRGATCGSISSTTEILVVQGKAEETIDCPADLVVANIHGEVMLRVMESAGVPAETPLHPFGPDAQRRQGSAAATGTARHPHRRASGSGTASGTPTMPKTFHGGDPPTPELPGPLWTHLISARGRPSEVRPARRRPHRRRHFHRKRHSAFPGQGRAVGEVRPDGDRPHRRLSGGPGPRLDASW
ncbi:MAG: 50S ribosomal protein L11 methyltransferase [Desulfobacterales bacterium]|nr:50S ribosomal protein L11 methyltransferase [Desulfobacterales bacterium]